MLESRINVKQYDKVIIHYNNDIILIGTVKQVRKTTMVLDGKYKVMGVVDMINLEGNKISERILLKSQIKDIMIIQ